MTGRLHPDCALILRRLATGTPFATLAGSPPPVAEARDLVLDGPAGALPARLYLPAPRRSLGLLVWLHGGGFVSGDLDGHDVPLRALAHAAGCAVLSVQYRLAPAHPFPAALEDAHAALCRASARARDWGCDPARLVVGGDSAGGNLATGAAMLCRDRGGPRLALQVLVYPDADARRGCNRQSWRDHDGLVLGRREKDRTLDLYLPGAIDRTAPLVSPALAPLATLRGLCPALVLTAEFDPQRDEGEHYAGRLREAGVAVALTRHDGMIHGFWQMGALLQAAHEATRQIAAAMASLPGA